VELENVLTIGEGVCLETICNVIDEREEIAEEDAEEEEESDDDDENEFWFRLVNYRMEDAGMGAGQ